MYHHLFVNICAIFGIASVVVIVCKFLRIKYVIGYLITGILLSPNTTNLFSDMSEVKVYAEIGVILLLFTIGLEFSFANLKRIKNYVLFGGGLQVVFTILLTTILIYLMHQMSLKESIFWGFLFALSSTAIVIKVMQDSGIINTKHGQFILAILLFQDVMIVPLILLTPILAGGGDSPIIEIVVLAGKLVLMGSIAFLLARYIIPFFFKTIMKIESKEVFLIALIFTVTGIVLISEQMGLSLALGAFIAGLIIAETDYHELAIENVLPFRYVFMSFFFISMGMLLDYRIFIDQFLAVVFWSVFIFIIKLLIATFAARLLKVSWATAIAVGLSLAQIGEFSFVLAQSGLEHKLMSESHYQLILAVSILLMAVTPLVVDNAEKIGLHIESKLLKKMNELT